MNAIRTSIKLSLRGYRTGRGGNTRRAKFHRVIEMVQPHMPVINQEFNEDESIEDVDAYESDFMNITDYEKLHMRELDIEKKKLLNNIVKSKYFKSNEPSMVTWGEKEQMKLLHEENPEEWTVDKLSQCFPVSREAALKIIRAKWQPKNVDVVTKYDKTVIENWKLFKARKLNIDDKLKAHLEKFKNRKIILMDEKTIAEKYLKPKPVFPKPKSTLFSNIIQGYLEEKKSNQLNDEGSVEKSAESAKNDFKETELNTEIMKINEKAPNEPKPTRTFDEFLKSKVTNMNREKMTKVDLVLLDEYKKQRNEDYASKMVTLTSKSPVGGPKDLEKIREKAEEEKAAIVATENLPKTQNKNNEESLETLYENSIETGIIARTATKEATKEQYPDYIQIPRNKRKIGATYRVEDRFYDYDGEFLYRVPILQE